MTIRLVACALLAPIFAFAQLSVDTGILAVTALDPSGAAVNAAVLRLKNQDTGVERSGVTSGAGEYRFLSVKPGMYELRVEKQGFDTKVTRDVQVSVGKLHDVEIKLSVGEQRQVVEVTHEADLVESQKTQQSNTLDQQYVRNLPIDRRDYLSFTLLAPGVADSSALADNSDFRVVQTPNSGLSFYGSNGRGNSITVDGGESNDAAGGVRPTLSQEAVQEFQVNRSNYSAELGMASGGVINIVSKGGTNALHGSAFGYFRQQSMDAGDPFARVLQSDGSLQRVKPDANRQQFGGSIGGPIRKDRTFIFGAIERLRRRESNVVSVLTNRAIFSPTPDQERILSALPSGPAGQLRAALSSPPDVVRLFETNSGITPFSTNDTKFSIRLDHARGEKDQFFFRYNFGDLDETNSSTRALVGASRGSRIRIYDSNVLGGWSRVVKPNLFQDLRVQFNYYDNIVSSLEKLGPELNINGYGFFNRDIFLPSDVITRRIEVKESLFYQRGSHGIKFGGMVNTRGLHADTQTFFSGRFTFGPLPGSLVNAALSSTTLTSLQAFNLGLPQSYQQGFGDPVLRATHPYYGMFIQDNWKVNSHLTLDFGLRYEIDTRVAPLRSDKNNFAPRFAFAWDPKGDGKTVVRGGYGIFFAPTYFQIDFVVNQLGEVNGRRPIAQVLTTIQTPGAASAANIYQTLRRQGVLTLPTPTRSIQASDLSQFGIAISQTGPLPPLSVLFEPSKDFSNSYSQQSSLAVERLIGQNWSISAGGVFTRTLKISRSRDRNMLPSAPVDPQLGIRVWRPQDFVNPQILQWNVYESTANAQYAAGMLEIQRRFRKLTLAGNYTFAKAIDDVTDYNSDFQPNDQLNLRAERALSAFDQRHKLVMYGVWLLPKDLQIAPIVRMNSGRPFNLLAGSDINQDRHNTTDRPPFAGRNTGRGPAFYTLDLRISKRLKLTEGKYLELTAEGFNIANKLNYSSINNTVGVIRGPFNLEGRHDRSPSEPLGFTSAFDNRRIQLGVRLAF
ncbi:MAG: TonB-dependent receptor [Bryobacterales bacterium]|nr:TonB-dependent receptor [Bryobacterales bacterium]